MPSHDPQSGRDDDFIGRLSPGIAHDIKSLLTPVSTFLQISRENPPASESLSELLPVALRNLETVQAYIDQGLYFAKHKTPRFRKTRLDQLVRRAVQLAEPDLKRKQQRLDLRIKGEVTAEIDEILVLRLLNNLIANAIDASQSDGTISVELDSSATDSAELMISNEWTESTKLALREEPARQRHGLGLQICREIVEAHHAKMTIDDSASGGHTVRVTLSSRRA